MNGTQPAISNPHDAVVKTGRKHLHNLKAKPYNLTSSITTQKVQSTYYNTIYNIVECRVSISGMILTIWESISPPYRYPASSGSEALNPKPLNP